MKQKIDDYAGTTLGQLATGFVPYLGEMEVCAEEIMFAHPPMPLAAVRLTNRKKKSLMGGVFALQISGELESKGVVMDHTPIRLYYEGMIHKGKAYFKHREGNNEGIVSCLNNDAELVNALTMSDLELGEICAGKDRYTINLSPISGSCMYTVFPPMRYTGSLPKQEIGQLFTILHRTSELLTNFQALV